MNEITKEIFKLCDEKYKQFSKKLIPTVDKERILGLRAPLAKAIAKKYAKSSLGAEFISSLPHKYHDEDIVHAYMLGQMELSCEEMKERLLALLPYVDSWAVCDTLASSVSRFFKNQEIGYDFLCELIDSSHTYKRRFGIVCLIYYINEEYIDNLIGLIPKVKSEEYYVNMASAWLISFMLIKQYEKTLPLLKDRALEPWVHNKAIQKARESFQISSERKEELKGLKIKKEDK